MQVITRYNLVYFLASLNFEVSLNRGHLSENNDDTDPFAFSSKDDKAPQAKRIENALVLSIRIRDLDPRKYGIYWIKTF